MAAAAGDLLAGFPEFFPETDEVALEVDGTGFSILLGAETGRASGGLCLGEGGVAWSRIVSGSSWRTMADCGGVCASDWVDWVMIWLYGSSESMETRCAAFSAAAKELSNEELMLRSLTRPIATDSVEIEYHTLGHRGIEKLSTRLQNPSSVNFDVICCFKFPVPTCTKRRNGKI